MSRSALLCLAAATVLIAGAQSAAAESPACSDLRAQLATLGSSRDSGVSDPGCNGGFFSRLLSGCGPLRSRFAYSPDYGQRRSGLLQALARYGCDSSSGGTVRTLCVRTCDGYYFPISNAANRKRLKVDEAVCHAAYPAGGAELYTQRYTGDDEGDMTSTSGKSYASQPFAFRYREAYDPSCAGQLQRELAPANATAVPRPPAETMAAGEAADQAANETPLRWVTPAPRVDRLVGPPVSMSDGSTAALTARMPHSPTILSFSTLAAVR